MTIIIKKMDKNDVHQVSEIERVCFTLAWSENLISAQLYNVNARYFVATMDNSKNEVIGYGGFIIVADEGHIMDIAVLPQFRKQGVAQKIISEFIKTAKQEDLTSLTLECRESNYPARKLYEKNNFEFIGLRPNYYDNIENACIYILNF